jgi:hypothetical protein
MSMANLDGQVFENVTMMMDNKYFTNCRFTGCTLIYTGGDFAWLDTTVDNCILRFEGDALRTIRYLNGFGKLTDEFVKQMGLKTE